MKLSELVQRGDALLTEHGDMNVDVRDEFMQSTLIAEEINVKETKWGKVALISALTEV